MADITLNITVKDAHVARTLVAINKYADCELRLDCDGSRQTFTYAPKGAGESNKDFAQRFLREMIRAFVRMSEFDDDMQRYGAAVRAIPEASQNVPDEIVE